MKHLIFLGTILISLVGQAALPPTAESLRRLQAITTSQELFNRLGPTQWVSSITAAPNGTYTVITNICAINVRVDAVQSDPPQMVPPLKVTLGQMNCLP